MDEYAKLIEGLTVALELCDIHAQAEAYMAIQFAIDWFGSEEDEVRDYLAWTEGTE